MTAGFIEEVDFLTPVNDRHLMEIFRVRSSRAKVDHDGRNRESKGCEDVIFRGTSSYKLKLE